MKNYVSLYSGHKKEMESMGFQFLHLENELFYFFVIDFEKRLMP